MANDMIAIQSPPESAASPAVVLSAPMSFRRLATLSVAAPLVLAACGSAPAQPASPTTPVAVPPAPVSTIVEPPVEALPAIAAAPQVRIDISIMSQCPYGVQAINGLYEMQRLLGASVEVAVDYIGNTSNQGELSSMHGPDEVTGDIIQLCVNQVAPARLLEFMHCQHRNYREIASNWAPCLDELGIPAQPVRRCIGSGEGRRLLTASFEKTRARGDTGSPTMRLAGERYEGGRRAGDFARAACARMNAPHSYCSSIPESPPVNVVILTDSKCAECNADRYRGMLKARIAKPMIRVVDFSTPEGKQLYDTTKPGNLPVLLFDATLDDDKEAFDNFQRGLQPTAGGYRIAALGGEYNPMCQTAAQCLRAECKDTIACRREIPGRLDIYVMSQCPFAVKATDSLEQVFKDFPTIDFRVHYIGSGDAKAGFNSMHGPSEVEENKRELCAISHYPSKRAYMKYIWCRNQDIRNANWESCTGKDIGIDDSVIRRCAEGPEGLKLLGESYASSKLLGIGASPTWIVNNKFKHSGIDAWTISKFICEHNPKLPACAKVPATAPTPNSLPARAVQPGCG